MLVPYIFGFLFGWVLDIPHVGQPEPPNQSPDSCPTTLCHDPPTTGELVPRSCLDIALNPEEGTKIVELLSQIVATVSNPPVAHKSV